MGWIYDNVDKIATVVISVVGAVYAAMRRFSGRVDSLERGLTDAQRANDVFVKEIEALWKAQEDMEGKVLASLNKLEERFREVLELKISVEKQDVLLNSIHEDVRELRDDVKRLMRNG